VIALLAAALLRTISYQLKPLKDLLFRSTMSFQHSMMATARVQTGDARSILTGKHDTTKPVEGKSSSLGRKAGCTIKEVGLMEFRFQPDLFERVTLALSPDRYRSGFVARQQRTARPIHDADGSMNRRGFARGTFIPGRCGKCAHSRSRIAETPVNITHGGRGTRKGVQCAVLRGYLALASHSGTCKGGCGDQCGRQKFKLGHSISPLDMKSQ
jgi:hypothetical protein